MKNLTSAIKTSRDTAKTDNNNNNESSAVTLTWPACKYTENKLPSPNPNFTKQFPCLTYNIAYIIHCTKRAQLYIGETGRILDTRFKKKKKRLAGVKHRRDKPVANHFSQTGHTIHNSCTRTAASLYRQCEWQKRHGITLKNLAAGNQME